MTMLSLTFLWECKGKYSQGWVIAIIKFFKVSNTLHSLRILLTLLVGFLF